MPASLRVILRELDRDLIRTRNKEEFQRYFPNSNLLPWAQQGVFLLNACLTVRAEAPNSHSKFGWQKFTGRAIELLMEKENIVFATWGKDAQTLLTSFTKKSSHLYLEAGHPASGSHGKDTYSGCSHFSRINQYLTTHNLEPINWKLHE